MIRRDLPSHSWSSSTRCEFSATAERQRFLTLLLNGVPGYIETRSFHPNGAPPRQTFSENIEQASTAVDRDCAAGLNVYVGVGTRGDRTKPETGRRSGGKDNLIALKALWVDRDGLTAEGAREEYEIALERFPFPPSIRVDSGGGEHTYWCLEEPLDLSTAGLIHEVECTLRGLVDVLGADPSATDASRIMRVPGTLNLPTPEKRAVGRECAPCTLLSYNSETYSFQDFEDFTRRGEALRPLAAPSTTFQPSGEKLIHPGRHDALTRHGAYLRKMGLSVGETEAALLVFNQERCQPPKPEEEVRQIAAWSRCIERDAQALRMLAPSEERAMWDRFGKTEDELILEELSR
jgi:hypothetical protein